ncbi:MAG TPA: TonB-dependent receptor [Vicinamibacterales bacterium]|nr:TonB-dependent receptor [Vicinamibacterales bacterium]
MLVRLRIPVFVSLFVLFLATASFAQTAPAAPAEPIKITESVVVTASGKEEPVSQVGASITVLTREQIEQRNALSTIDLLRTVPGVIAARTGGVGNLTSLWVRGGESSHNKVLIDGMPLNEPGGVFNFANLSPENIERIEVLRGSHSALFGSDAMASVIQIFTIRPTAATPQVNLTIDGGNYGTGHVAAGMGAVRGPIEYSIFGSRLSTDNREPNNAHRATTFSGMLGARQRSGGLVRFIGRGEIGRTGAPGQTAFGRPDMDAFFKHTDSDALLGWDQPLGSRVLQRASYSFTQTRQRSTNLVTDPPYTAQFGSLRAPFQSSDFLYDSGTHVKRHRLDYRADTTLRPNQTLTVAFAYDGERGVLTDFRSTATPQKPTRNNTGTTVQYAGLAGPVSVMTGVRFENNGSFGFYVAPRASISWLISSGDPGAGTTRLKASGGRGIKEPTFRQSYSPSPFDLGNPDLKPERSRGFDAGVEQRFANDRIRAEATYFYNHFDDLINTGPFNPVTFGSQYLNIGETRASGLELSADAMVAGGLQVHGYYVWQDSEVINSVSSSTSPIFTKGKELYRRPRHSGSIQGQFTRSRVSLALGALFVGQRVDTDSASLGIFSNEGYTTVNASADVRFARRTSGFINLENLGDFQYMEPLGYRGLGRTVRAGIRTRF